MSKNGYLRPDELTTVQGSMQLRNDTARVFFTMRDDCAEEEHQNLILATPAGAYRSDWTQHDMRVPSRHAYYNITPGIVPGLPSEHGFGTCMDFATCLAWVKKNGHRYGVTFPLSKTDPNHGRYDGVTLAGELGSPLTPEPVIDLGDDMKLITHPNGQPAMTDGALVFLQISAFTMTQLETIYGPHIPVSAEAWQFTTDRVTEHVAWINSLKTPISK